MVCVLSEKVDTCHGLTTGNFRIFYGDSCDSVIHKFPMLNEIRTAPFILKWGFVNFRDIYLMIPWYANSPRPFLRWGGLDFSDIYPVIPRYTICHAHWNEAGSIFRTFTRHEKDFSVLRILRIMSCSDFFQKKSECSDFFGQEKKLNKPVIAPIFGPVRKKNRRPVCGPIFPVRKILVLKGPKNCRSFSCLTFTPWFQDTQFSHAHWH